ncbi:MAG: 2-oxoacid:acceptor oxidoreductase family protein [Deltaproteobacteria bacterium]|nr:2-oxoacid:acceptor oxidoreductase family protein [Deltaproteobacteria bacterium]
MQSKSHYQIVISGVGGQGVLFITRLLAEAAIEKGLPVFTSETHGMAQRGGTVISHLKVGEFASPLISPGQADGLIALKAESLDQHGGYLKPGGWAAVNVPAPLTMPAAATPFYLDADRLAREMDNPRSVNLIMLGFTLSSAQRGGFGHGSLHCSLNDIEAVLENRLKGKTNRLQSSLRALKAGADSTTAT